MRGRGPPGATRPSTPTALRHRQERVRDRRTTSSARSGRARRGTRGCGSRFCGLRRRSIRSVSPRVPTSRVRAQEVVRRRSPRRRRRTRACRAARSAGVQPAPGGIELQEGVLDEMTRRHDDDRIGKAMAALRCSRRGSLPSSRSPWRLARRWPRAPRATAPAAARGRWRSCPRAATTTPSRSLDRLDARPQLAIGLVSATQGRYTPTQALLDISPGHAHLAGRLQARAAAAARARARRRRQRLHLRLDATCVERATTAPAEIQPGLLAQPHPGRRRATPASAGRDTSRPIAAADRGGRRRGGVARHGRRPRATRAHAAAASTSSSSSGCRPAAGATRRSTSCCATAARATLLHRHADAAARARAAAAADRRRRPGARDGVADLGHDAPAGHRRRHRPRADDPRPASA